MGGEPARKRSKPKKPEEPGDFTVAQRQLSDAAIVAWNAVARRLGFTEVRVLTISRRSRLLRRIADIGGIEQFLVALSAIERVPFLMGKVAPRPGEQPFKLDIDRLLQSEGRLGDVLAKLVDKAGDETDEIGPNGHRWGWWRGKEDRIRTLSLADWRSLDAQKKPNGVWPWWAMGAPPGHAECLVPEELINEKGYAETYQGKTRHD